MKLLDKLVLKEVTPTFLGGVAMFMAFYFLIFPISDAAKYFAQGVPLWIVAKIVVLNLAPALGYTFPMGMLVAMLLGFGRLSDASEAVALFAAGVPFLRIAASALVLGALVSGVGFVLNDHFAATANQKIADLKDEFFHNGGASTQPIDFPVRKDGKLQLTVHVEGGFDTRIKAMRNVTITAFDPRSGEPTATVYGETAQFAGGTKWSLKNIKVLGANEATLRMAKGYSYDLNQTPDSTAFLARDPDTLDFHDLQHRIADLKANGMGNSPNFRDAEVTLWTKVALPLASLVFALIGAPLGLRPQRTPRSLGWSLAIVIIAAYYVIYTATGSLARGGALPPIPAAFLPDIIGFATGGWLIWKASN